MSRRIAIVEDDAAIRCHHEMECHPMRNPQLRLALGFIVTLMFITLLFMIVQALMRTLALVLMIAQVIGG